MPPDEQQDNVAQGAWSPASERTRSFFGRNTASIEDAPVDEFDDDKGRPTRWSMGVLNDPKTHEVPGMPGNQCRGLKPLNANNSTRVGTFIDWRP
jgi:hypothetical protein